MCTPCLLVISYPRFEGTYCLHLEGEGTEEMKALSLLERSVTVHSSELSCADLEAV